MASSPNYDGTPRNGSLILNNASSTTLSAAVITGVTAGTRIKEIRIVTGPSTSPGSNKTLVVIRDDGVSAIVIDTILLIDAPDFLQIVFRYDNEVLVGTGQSLKFQMRTALPSGCTVHIDVQGCDK